MYNKVKHGVALLAATVALASCVDDVNLNPSASQSTLDEVYFTASIAEQDFYGTKKPQTRSAADESQSVQSGFYDLPIEGRNDLMLSVSTLDGMFGKYSPIPEDGRQKPATRGMAVTELSQQPMSVFEIAKTSEGRNIAGDPYTAYTDDGATWGGSHIKHSSSAVTRTVYAVYPSSDKYTIHPATRTLQYTTPLNASDQCDLLYARADQSLGSEQKDSLHLTFNHLLTAVRFKIGSQQLPMSVIKNIVIEGISTSGLYRFDKDEWELYQGVNGVMSYQDFNTTGAENVIINGGENTFMLLPQKLTSSAKVTIYYEDYTEGDDSSQGTKSLTASLATNNTAEWKAGQSVTYTLMDKDAKSDYVLEVELPGDLEFGPEGGSQPVNVLSYRHVGDDITPMQWKVQSYSSDGGKTWMSGGATNVPAGMAVSPTEGISEGTDTTRLWVTLLPSETVYDSHSEFLRYKTPLGHDGDAFDLSRHDYLNKPCAQTTANCYVVDAPGKYRIPTAYGNAIVNGQTNKAAYTDKAGYGSSGGNNFIAHNGNAISAPMIRNNGITLSRASLVWQDVNNLIDPESIKLVEDGNAIEFEIPAASIDQGNAVIAAMEGNNVAWSWHIWVTDEKASLAEPIEDMNMNREKVDFMPLTLGWCSTSKASGRLGREAAVRIVMPANLKKRASFCIRQTPSPAVDLMNNVAGNATYYNWGRKDPFPGAQSTVRPVGSDEDASALPKPFYQGGADAAGLGLHAELHTKYGTNKWQLFWQGATVGVKGFLTGYSLAKMYQSIKSMGPSEQQIVKGYKTEDAVYHKCIIFDEEFAKKGLDITPQNFSQKLMERSPEVITKDFNIHIPKEIQWKLIPKSPTEYYYVVYSTDDVPMYAFDIITTPEVVSPFGDVTVPASSMVFMHPLTPAVPTKLVGPFSRCIMSAVGATLSSSDLIGTSLANSSLFDGSMEWCKEIQSHGVPLAYAIQHPNTLLRDPISWINHDGVGNLWNANQTEYDDTIKAVVKTIYDPCPAGYHVPSAREMNGFVDDATETSNYGSTKKTTAYGKQLFMPGVGYRNFWDTTEPGSAATNNINDMIFYNGSEALYWTASPAINKDEKGEKGAYVVNLRQKESYDYFGEKEGYKNTPRAVHDLKLQQSYALPIRPVREK